MAEITRLLARAGEGDAEVMARLYTLLYPELRRLAGSRLGRGGVTLTPTVLVHEAFVRMVGSVPVGVVERRQFFACAARVMRSVVVDATRRRTAQKRGGGQSAITLTDRIAPQVAVDDELLALDDALDRLRERNPRQSEVVELHYFAGLPFADIAELHGHSERTAKRDWERARAFLYAQLE